MAAEKRWRLVCYDVRDEKRYRKVYKIIRGAGHAVQYSVFRCRLDDLETERLRWRLSKVMDVEDALLIVDLCPSCAKRVISRNHVEGWAEEPPTFRVLGAPSGDQGSTSGREPEAARHAEPSGTTGEGDDDN